MRATCDADARSLMLCAPCHASTANCPAWLCYLNRNRRNKCPLPARRTALQCCKYRKYQTRLRQPSALGFTEQVFLEAVVMDAPLMRSY